MAGLSTQDLLSEVSSAKALLQAVEDQLAGGLPGVDVPGSDQGLIEALGLLGTRLFLVSHKCKGVMTVLQNAATGGDSL